VGDGSVAASGTTLDLTVPAGTDHDVWTGGNRSLRVMQSVPDADVEVEVKFASVPTQKHQIQGLLFEEAPGEFIRFDFYSDGREVRIFSAGFSGGSPTVEVSRSLGGLSAPLWMRVARIGDTWTQSYSVDGTTWTQTGQFTWALGLSQAGIFAGNAGDNPGYTAQVDYFQNLGETVVASTEESTTKSIRGDRVSSPTRASIEAASLHVSQTPGTVLLQWDTYLPVNTFDLQQRTKGMDFQTTKQFRVQTEASGSYEHVLHDLTPGTYEFRLVQTLRDGRVSAGEPVEIQVELTEPYLVSGVFPNPSSSNASLRLMVAEREHVRIEVFNLLGQRVALIQDGPMEGQTPQTFAIPVSSLSSGTYFVRVKGDSFLTTSRMAIIR
jgi:hypothetical protein